jgi:hypothetical protein
MDPHVPFPALRESIRWTGMPAGCSIAGMGHGHEIQKD